MASLDTSRAAYTAVGFVERLGQAFAGTVASFAEWNDARVTRNSLARLTDRELDDIGLCRGDIADVSRRR
ncbi:DUF1127 domain-containing protein [Aquicoccus sp. SCR17]|nr:DUF1127 domain-containing protein [Carideicomes alvinocaridis]